MKPDYKNWVPKGLVAGIWAGTAVAGGLLAAVLFTDFLLGGARLAAEILLGLLFGMLLLYSLFCSNMYFACSYNGKKQFSRRIIEKVAEYVHLPEGGAGLDVGCGSGALTIACAKHNPSACMVGLDRWGKEYASFSKTLCENNAKIEGVLKNTAFVKGDACKLDFADETFDAVVSNYCYHNIPAKDRQAILLESLRVLKKGGIFVIHDWFIKSKYGDMQKFLQKLRDMGYEKVELLDTTTGLFMTPNEARMLCMKGSALLIGKK